MGGWLWGPHLVADIPQQVLREFGALRAQEDARHGAQQDAPQRHDVAVAGFGKMCKHEVHQSI